jgi:hypothetical protein
MWQRRREIAQEGEAGKQGMDERESGEVKRGSSECSGGVRAGAARRAHQRLAIVARTRGPLPRPVAEGALQHVVLPRTPPIIRCSVSG